VKTRTLLAVLLSVLVVTAAKAQSSSEQKPAPPADRALQQLVEQLGDPDYRKRDIAADLLKAEGVKALPVLRAALKDPDAEVRRRLMELIPSIETAAILAPKRVTLSVKDKPLKQIFDELTKQTAYKFEFHQNNPSAKYSFDFDNVTYWEALEQITKKTGQELQQGYGDDIVRFYYRGEGAGSPFTYRDDSFRFTATNFQLYKTLDLTQPGHGVNARSENLTFMFAVQSEPKLPLLGVGEPRLTAAFDADKKSMLVPSNPGDPNEWEGRRGYYVGRYGNGNRMWYIQTQVNLVRVSEKTTSVKELRGTLPVTLLAEQKPHVVAEKLLKAKGAKATVGSTTIHIEEASAVANTNQIQVRLSFTEDTAGNQNDYSWQNSIYQRLEVQDEKGQKYQVYGQNWGHQTPTSMQITYTFAPMDPNKKSSADAKLVFYEWKVLQHQLNFEFKDLPLP
jgi:hypothetical protein